MSNCTWLGLALLFCGANYATAMSDFNCYSKVNGTRFSSDDGCSTCVCIDGAIQCVSNPCPILNCHEELIEQDDEKCCPRCKPGCYAEEFGTMEPGESKTSDDKCYTCECTKNSIIACMHVDCPPCSGHWSNDSSCCGHCDLDHCVVDGIVYKDGEIIPGSGPCETCHCIATGEVVERMCYVQSCEYCPGKWTDDGTCCGLCELADMCEHNGDEYMIGDEVPSGSPCTHCYCDKMDHDSGPGVVCISASCPQCLGKVTDDGSCCGKCEPMCDVMGVFYADGTEVPGRSPCEVCNCELNANGIPEIICMPIVCAIQCPQGQELVRDDESCCGHCEAVMIPLPNCETINCPEVKCPEKLQFYPPGSCCPQCKCRYKKEILNPGPFGDKCKGCVCDNGKVICTKPKCPENNLKCVDGTLGEDCCYHCPNGITCFAPKVKGMIIKAGETKKVKSDYCTCIDDPWHPNGYCAKSKVSRWFPKKYGTQLANYSNP